MNTHKEEHQHRLPHMPRELEFHTGKAVTFKFICRDCGEEAIYRQLSVEPTPPSQIEVDRLIKQARADQLKKLWNATQHDIVPEGTPPRDMSEELHKMIKELEK